MPTRAVSPDSDIVDRMSSSSPEPPEDPLAGVIIGSQSRAAKRGEYVPVPTRSYVPRTRVASSSKARGSTNIMSPPATRPVSRAKPSSKPSSYTQSTAKPPSRSRPPSRPPVSKGKREAKEFIDVVEISDDSGDEGIRSSARPTPLHPSRRGNVTKRHTSPSSKNSVQASTSTPTGGLAVTTATVSRKKPPSTVASKRRITRQASIVRLEPSGDGPRAFVMVDEGHDTGSKRRRIDIVAGGDGEVESVVDAGAPMDVDINFDADNGVGVHTDIKMDVDGGYQSDSTLSYMSDEPMVTVETERTPRQRQLDTVREESSTPARESAPEDDERPFPDFEALRGPASIGLPASTVSESPKNAALGNTVKLSRHENAVAGPSNSNSCSHSDASPSATSTSTSGAAITAVSKPKPSMSSTIITNTKFNLHASLFDNAGMSHEDAAAAYGAMFGEEHEAPLVVPIPPLPPVAPVVPEADKRWAVDVGDVVMGKGKGKARLEAESKSSVGAIAVPNLDPALDREPEQAPMPVLNWGPWDPLRLAGRGGGQDHAQGTRAINAAQPKAKGVATALAHQPESELELSTMEEHFLHALRAATAASASQVEAGEGEADGAVPAHVAYMRRATRAFEQAWRSGASVQERGTGKGKGKERAREDVEPAAAAAAQNVFTFTFPRGTGARAEPPATQPQPRRAETSRQQHEVQQRAVAAPRDPWAWLLEPPMPGEPEHIPQEPQHLNPPAPLATLPVAQAFALGVAPTLPALPPVPLPVVTPEALVAGEGSALQPGAFTLIFPRGALGPAALRNVQNQVRGPGPVVALQSQAPVQPQPLRLPPPTFIPPVGPAQPPPPAPRPEAPVQAPVQAPHVRAAAPPAPALTREQLTERAIAQITEILPDVEPRCLLALVGTHVSIMKERTADRVLGILFEAEAAGGYPRVVREKAQLVPEPARPPPIPIQQAQIQPRAQGNPPQPLPVAGGGNLGVRARGGNVQGPAVQQRVEQLPNQEAKVIDYEDVNRPMPSEAYRRLGIHYLRLAFPFLPKHIVTTAMYQHHTLYAPTYLNLHAAECRYTAFPVRDQRPYRCNSTKYNAGPERRVLAQVWDEAFGEEWLWVEARQGRSLGLAYSYTRVRASHGAPHDAAAVEHAVARHVPVGAPAAGPARMQHQPQAAILPVPAPHALVIDHGKGKQRVVDVDMDPPAEEQVTEEEGDIECGCCFSEYTFDKMVQCPDAHLFCSECVSQYAATQLGAHNTSIVCMHSSDCKLPFPESELRRVLTPTLMALYSRLTAQKAIAAAGLEGLEECPFCDWQCVIEVPIEMDWLFRCGNAEGGCGEVSCRGCKKKDHRPKTCKEMEENQVLDGQHAIEEAMTRALMRNCPNLKCKKAFVKETGCNKMTCPHCRTVSCYVCRQIIKGYDHFDMMPGAPANTAIAGRCKLWENVEERHVNEVRVAAERAAEELRRANPELDHEAIKVDIPVAPPPAPVGIAHRAVPAPVVNPHQVLQQRAAQLRVEQERLRRLAQEEFRRQLELRAEIVRQGREQQAERRRREREAQKLRKQEALRIRLQQQQELNHAALAAQRDAARLDAMDPGPFAGPMPALPPVMPALHGADRSNRGRKKQ